MAQIINDGLDMVAPDRLREHPANPRQGDVGAIYESITENGFYGAVIAQRSTGYVLAGNHRLKAAREAGLDALPVIWVDVDDERAMRILLADNRTNDRADYDRDALAQLLEHLATTDAGLAGTGYDGDALDELLAVTRGVDGMFVDARPDERGHIPEQRAAAYGESTVRQIILLYQAETYERVVDALAALCRSVGVASNAEVVLHLLGIDGADNDVA